MRKVPPELGEWVLRRTDQPSSREALSVRVSHRFTAGSARFDEDNLVSHAGLVPLLGLAQQTRLPEIIAEKVSIKTPRIKSGAANPAAKLLGGPADQAFIDIDSLLRPVYGHAKQGASYGHTKIAGKHVLRKGLSPLATTISTEHCAPVIAGMRLRAGKTGSGKGAGRMVAQAIATARAAGATGKILVRGDSAYGNRAVVRACRRGNAEFSLVMTKNPAITRAIAAIPDTAWTPVRYPGAVRDPDTGAWISDAEVAEVPYTAFAATQDRITARLVVRRVKDARYPDALFPVWRYHPFFTNTDRPTVEADIVHRRHAIIETVFADLIDGPLAHLPSGHFGANSAWALCAAIAHNLLHTAGVLAAGPDTAGATPGAHARARGATLRRQLITVPARLARPARAPLLHLPSRWPWSPAWLRLWNHTTGHSPPVAA